MLDYDESLTSFETPRMRWRVRGIREYVKQLVLSVARYAGSVALFLLLLSLRTKPFWHAEGLRIVLFGAFLGSAIRLFFECMPGNFTFNRRMFSYSGPVRLRRSWAECRNIQLTELDGIARLDVEIPRHRKSQRFEKVTIAVSSKYAGELASLLSETNKPIAVLPDGPIPLEYVPRKFSLFQPLAFPTGVMLLMISALSLVTVALQLMSHRRLSHIFFMITALVACGCGIAGVFCIRFSLPWQKEVMRQAQRRRERAAQRRDAQNNRGK